MVSNISRLTSPIIKLGVPLPESGPVQFFSCFRGQAIMTDAVNRVELHEIEFYSNHMGDKNESFCKKIY